MRFRNFIFAATALAGGGLAVALPVGGASADGPLWESDYGDCHYETYFEYTEGVGGRIVTYETCTRMS